MFAYSDFVAAFPEFSNAATYPQAQVAFWQNIAYAQLNAARFGKMLDLAAMLFVAHNIVLSSRNVAAAQNGGVVGQANGPVSSKSVGQVSVSYDTGSVSLDNAGHWNLTTYGQRFYKMLRGYSLGPVYAAGPRRTVGF